MTKKNRLWQSDLMAFVESRESEPFVWGKQDCALFAADAVQVMTGIDFAAEFRGKYKTETGARKQLAKLAGGGLEQALDAKLERVENAFVQRGDVVLFDGDLGPTLGIYFNGGVFSAGPDGAVFLDEAFDKILMAWRV